MPELNHTATWRWLIGVLVGLLSTGAVIMTTWQFNQDTAIANAVEKEDYRDDKQHIFDLLKEIRDDVKELRKK